MRDVFMWRTEAARAVYMYNDATARPLLDAPRKDYSPLFFGGLEFKRFKAISQGVERRIVGPRTPIDRRQFFLSALLLPAPFCPFSR